MGSLTEGLPTNTAPKPALLKAKGVGLRSVAVVQEEASAILRRPAPSSSLSPVVPFGVAPTGLAVVQPGVVEPPGPTRARDGVGELPSPEVAGVAVVPPASVAVTTPEVPTRLADAPPTTSPITIGVVRLTEVIVTPDAKLCVTFPCPPAAARTAARSGPCATAAAGNGPTPTAPVTTTATGLIPRRPASVLPPVTGRDVVRPSLAVQIGPGLRSVRPRSVAPRGMASSAGDA